MDRFGPQYMEYLINEYLKIRAKYRPPIELNEDGKPNWKTINGARVLIDDDGNVSAGPQGIKQWAGTAKKKGKTKYAPSPQRQKKGIQIGKEKYGILCGIMNTRYPELKPEDGIRSICDANYVYFVEADGYDGMTVHRRIKIK